MSNVNIEMMRIDERLIHGQGQMWLNALFGFANNF